MLEGGEDRRGRGDVKNLIFEGRRATRHLARGGGQDRTEYFILNHEKTNFANRAF